MTFLSCDQKTSIPWYQYHPDTLDISRTRYHRGRQRYQENYQCDDELIVCPKIGPIEEVEEICSN